mgnify:CR=1 FL=1
MGRRLSVVLPVLNEAGCLADTLACLQPLRQRGHQVILADGGSDDDSVRIATPLVDDVLTGPAGRGRQMNQGAGRADGDVLLFLHADTRVPAHVDRVILTALGSCSGWGRFDIGLSGSHPLLRLVELSMNLRSRLTRIATGDQGLFVSRDLFERCGGFSEQPLMEDIDLSRALKRLSRPLCLPQRLVTSSRRWEQRGMLRTVMLMWYLRAAYFLGVPAERLARRYY